MSKTPEGIVKDAIKNLLHGEGVYSPGHAAFERSDPRRAACVGWYYMPAQNGMGAAGIPDFVGCYKGHFFGIEAKAPGKEPNHNQVARHHEIRAAGGQVFIIDHEANVAALYYWLRAVPPTTEMHPSGRGRVFG